MSLRCQGPLSEAIHCSMMPTSPHSAMIGAATRHSATQNCTEEVACDLSASDGSLPDGPLVGAFRSQRHATRSSAGQEDISCLLGKQTRQVFTKSCCQPS